MSPAATQTLSQADAAVLAAADDLFFERGVSAVTIAEVRDRAGVSLRRLYSLYPSKADLVAGWLRHRHTTWIDRFTRDVHHSIDEGASVVDSVFDALATWLTDTDYRGCGFINTLAETGELTPEHQSIIRDHKRAVTEFLATVFDDATTLAVLVDGAIVQSSIFRNTMAVEAARSAARRISA